jgi:hypothetical protein
MHRYFGEAWPYYQLMFGPYRIDTIRGGRAAWWVSVPYRWPLRLFRDPAICCVVCQAKLNSTEIYHPSYHVCANCRGFAHTHCLEHPRWDRVQARCLDCARGDD